MACRKFKVKPTKGRLILTPKQIMKKLFPKKSFVETCICSMNCSADDCIKMHYTLLYLKNPYQAAVDSTYKQNFLKQDKICSFLQVIPVKVTHSADKTVVNDLLNSGSDTILIVGENPKTKRETMKINITNALYQCQF